MKVWRWGLRGLDELEVRPVPGLPSRVVRGCENCSHQLTLGRDVFKTETAAMRSRKRELLGLLTRARTRVVELQAQLDLVAETEQKLRVKKRV